MSIEERLWDGARGGAKSARVSGSDGATSRAVWLHLVPGCTDACTQVGLGGGLDRFSGIVKRCWDCAGGRAQSARVSGSDGATAQAMCLPCVFLVTPMHAHISARAVDEADFSTEKWCWDCAGGRAQSARVSGSDGATAQAVCRPWVCSCLCDVCFGGELDCGGCGARAATVGCRVNAIAICVKARFKLGC